MASLTHGVTLKQPLRNKKPGEQQIVEEENKKIAKAMSAEPVFVCCGVFFFNVQLYYVIVFCNDFAAIKNTS